MSNAARNIMVGLFVLIALVLLGAIIVMFGGHPNAFSNTYLVRMHFPSAGPIIQGSDVRVAGVSVGRVTDISPWPLENFSGGVQITAEITRGYKFPKNCTPVIRPVMFGLGKPALDIDLPTVPSKEVVPRTGDFVLEGRIQAGFEGLIPPAMQKKLDNLDISLQKLADAMVQLVEPRPTAAVDHPPATGPAAAPGAATRPEAPMANLSTLVQRLDFTIKRVNELLAAPNGDVAVLLANLRDASANAKDMTVSLKQFAAKAVAVADRADATFQTGQTTLNTANAQLKRLGDALADNSAQLAGSLDRLNKSLDAIAQGKGSIGKMINDPTLYENLLLSSDRLHQAIIDLQKLVQQWAAQGIKLKF